MLSVSVSLRQNRGWSQGLKGQEKQGTLQRALRAKALPLQHASAMERAVA